MMVVLICEVNFLILSIMFNIFNFIETKETCER